MKDVVDCLRLHERMSVYSINCRLPLQVRSTKLGCLHLTAELFQCQSCAAKVGHVSHNMPPFGVSVTSPYDRTLSTSVPNLKFLSSSVMTTWKAMLTV